MPPRHAAALVLLSGGQDSTTCLFWALQTFERVEALGFDYGQRHGVELLQARKIAQLAGVPFHCLEVPSFKQLGGSALTDPDFRIPQGAEALPSAAPSDTPPSTFVPGRNLVFLSLAAGFAYLHRLRHIVLGVGEVDYSGYPDCREPFLISAKRTLSLALDCPITLHAPLLRLSKADIFRLAADLGCLDVVLQQSHTCYLGDRTTQHPWGYGCGTCAACQLRARGFQQAFPPAPPA